MEASPTHSRHVSDTGFSSTMPCCLKRELYSLYRLFAVECLLLFSVLEWRWLTAWRDMEMWKKNWRKGRGWQILNRSASVLLNEPAAWHPQTHCTHLKQALERLMHTYRSAEGPAVLSQNHKSQWSWNCEFCSAFSNDCSLTRTWRQIAENKRVITGKKRLFQTAITSSNVIQV